MIENPFYDSTLIAEFPRAATPAFCFGLAEAVPKSLCVNWSSLCHDLSNLKGYVLFNVFRIMRLEIAKLVPKVVIYSGRTLRVAG